MDLFVVNDWAYLSWLGFGALCFLLGFAAAFLVLRPDRELEKIRRTVQALEHQARKVVK